MDAEERQALREVTRRYLDDVVDHTAAATVLAAAEGFDRGQWAAMATQLGLQGTGISEDAGGAGLGLAGSLLVHEELGRALYGGPFLGTVGQVVPGLQALGNDAAATGRLEQIAAGKLTAAAAVPIETLAAVAPGRQSPLALSGPLDRPAVTGSLPLVVDAPLADALLAVAAGPAGLSLLWIDASAPGVKVDRIEAVDLTRRFGQVTFDGALAEVIGGAAQAQAALAAIRRGLMLALTAECVGVAARCLEMAVGHVATRHQFGRPIGSFQAIKHRCADLLIALEAARSALRLATSPATSPLEAEARLAAARIRAGEAAFTIANENIHLHGGIGFTWEYPAHLFYRRAKSNQQLLDSTGGQRGHLAATVFALYAEQEQAS
jgi:alkylation response protein AidB-like acyl-CoA dehydrogenase